MAARFTVRLIGATSTAFTPLERDVMAYAEAMTTTPTSVTDDLSERLLEELGPAGMVELTAYIGFSNFSARCNTLTSASRDGDQPGRPRIPNAAANCSSSSHSPS